MKNYGNIIAALNHCASDMPCRDCPYHVMEDCNCYLMKDAARLIDELEDRLEHSTTACDHEIIAQSHSEEIRKLHDKLADAEITLERTQRELNEAEQELKYLRVIKATAEAFLGVKIDGQM